MAKYSFDFPSNNALVDDDKDTTLVWTQWFQRIQTIVASEQQSGPTSQRPDKGLWVGRRYFDTTRGYPVYLRSISPVVWVNGAGTIV